MFATVVVVVVVVVVGVAFGRFRPPLSSRRNADAIETASL
jgi:hypothetical protein